jgi:antitoxin component YwqK of YwqJK toxin-antitoxin module
MVSGEGLIFVREQKTESMKQLVLWMMFLAPLVGSAQQEKLNQVDAQGKKHGKWVKAWPGKNIKQLEGTFNHGVPTGEFKAWYETGEVHMISMYAPDGKTKRTKIYHPNGYLMAKGKYVNELRDSVWLFYNEIGRVQSKENYVAGKLEGELEIYYTAAVQLPNGEMDYVPGIPSHIYTYKNGLRNGVYKELFTNGKLKAEGTYKDGNLDGKQVRYRADGSKESVVYYKHAVKNGQAEFYNPYGEVIKRVYYLNDKVLEGAKLEQHLQKIKEEKAANK